MREQQSKCLDCIHFGCSGGSNGRSERECECEGLFGMFGNVTKTGDKAVGNCVHPSIGPSLRRKTSV